MRTYTCASDPRVTTRASLSCHCNRLLECKRTYSSLPRRSEKSCATSVSMILFSAANNQTAKATGRESIDGIQAVICLAAHRKSCSQQLYVDVSICSHPMFHPSLHPIARRPCETLSASRLISLNCHPHGSDFDRTQSYPRHLSDTCSVLHSGMEHVSIFEH